MKRPALIHPILLGMYPLIALIGINIDQLSGKDVWRSFAWVLGATVCLCILAFLLARDWDKAGLACSLALVLFFSWGHVFRLIQGKMIGGILIGRANVLLAIWAAIWILGSWWIVRVMARSRAQSWTKFLNVASLIALIFPIVQILAFILQTMRVSDVSPEAAFEPIPLPATLPDELPDIYYIIVDGYGREDILRQYYAHDNAEFIQSLQERGFYIADQSHSNYAQTTLSLSSSLNLGYVNELAAGLSQGSTSREPLAKLIQHSRLQDVLSRAGYQIVALPSGYSVTEFINADHYLKRGNTLNHFETMWLTSSVAAVVIDIIHPIWYRQSLLTNLETLADMPDTGSPRFVFTHLLIPHPPFVFGPEGEAIPPKSFKEGNYYEGTMEEYITGYRGQVTFLNGKLIQAIDGILETSDPQPIIILQGDHGPGAHLNWDDMGANCFEERMSILNAYYVPDFPTDALYPSITPVNSFRVLLDGLFGTELGALEDRSYFSLWNSLYDLEDITDRLDTCDSVPQP